MRKSMDRTRENWLGHVTRREDSAVSGKNIYGIKRGTKKSTGKTIGTSGWTGLIWALPVCKWMMWEIESSGGPVWSTPNSWENKARKKKTKIVWITPDALSHRFCRVRVFIYKNRAYRRRIGRQCLKVDRFPPYVKVAVRKK